MEGELTGQVAVIPPDRPEWEEADEPISVLIGKFLPGTVPRYEVDSPVLEALYPVLLSAMALRGGGMRTTSLNKLCVCSTLTRTSHLASCFSFRPPFAPVARGGRFRRLRRISRVQFLRGWLAFITTRWCLKLRRS